jgi:small subunit ribosomal protein S2
MGPFIFKRRNLIHIIDLRETLRGLIVGKRLTEAVAARGDYVLLVGTKKQAREAVLREAQRCSMPCVADRWPGGLLTNYATIRTRLARLSELETLEQTGEIKLYSKKMISSLRREQRKILRNLGGVRKMERLPGLLVLVDPAREHLAVKEAGKLGIPVIALTDTDGDPESIDVVVPGNDDSIGAIEIFLTTMSEAALVGLGARGPYAQAEPAQEGSRAEGQGLASVAEPVHGEPSAAGGASGPKDIRASDEQKGGDAGSGR